MASRNKNKNQAVELSVFKKPDEVVQGHVTQVPVQPLDLLTPDLEFKSSSSETHCPVYNTLSVSSKGAPEPPKRSGNAAASEASLLRLEQDFDEPLFRPRIASTQSRRKWLICLIVLGVSIIIVALSLGLSITFLRSSSTETKTNFESTSLSLTGSETRDFGKNHLSELQPFNSSYFPITFPIPDLKAQMQENFKDLLTGLKSSITSDRNASLIHSNASSTYLSALPPLANVTVVTEAITAGTEALSARHKTEQRIAQLGLTGLKLGLNPENLGLNLENLGSSVANLSSSLEKYGYNASEGGEPLGVGGAVGQLGGRGERFLHVANADEIHKLSLIGFSMERASRVIAKRLNLSKAEAEEGILLDPKAKIEPSTWCAAQGSHVLDRNCNVTEAYRTLTGRCNNLNHAQWGMALQPFRRVLASDFYDGISAPRKAKDNRQLPNAKYISNTVFADRNLNDSTLTYLFPMWAEFIERDMQEAVPSFGENNSEINCCEHDKLLEIQHPECFPIYLNPDDQFFDKLDQHCVNVVRSAAAPSCSFGAREQFNLKSAFIDGSTIYGALNTEEALANGRILPNGQIFSDDSNKTFWTKHHNYIAEQLALINPHWKSDRTFEEAKRIVIGEIQHITLNEYLPALLGESVVLKSGLKGLQNGYYEEYDKTINPGVSNVFSSTASKFRFSMLRQEIAAESNSTKESHRSTHFSINPFLSVFSHFSNMELLVRDMAFNYSGIADTSFQQIHRSDQNSNSSIAAHALESSPLGTLAAIVIQRGRDHGIPAYPRWRKLCGLTEVHNFSALEGIWSHEDIERIQSVYSSLDDVDLYVGGMAEIHGSNATVGPTFACILADQFSRSRKGDRFWFEGDIQIKAFTPDQLSSIRRVTLASLLCGIFQTLGAIQGQVLRESSEENLIQPCSTLAASSVLNFTAWQEDKPIPGIQIVLTDGSVVA